MTASATPETEAEQRDRQLARLSIRATIAWLLIWTCIVASLFLFGGALSSVVA